MNNMPAAGDNGIENEQLLDALLGPFPADPSNLPDFWSDYCNLALVSSSYAGFFKDCSADDVDDRKQRFTTPTAHARHHIIPYLLPGEHPKLGLPIRAYLNDGTYYPLLFKQRCDNKYVITHRGPPEIRRWSDVCRAMGLRRRDRMRMWVYRYLGSYELCICIAKEVRSIGDG